ncbi:MAG: hypothetical protein EXS51_02450 [Candidatus Taylorbacteria bacterium]|nr:hypothetical protein [Candidatus Taylorbacteria bacterium]
MKKKTPHPAEKHDTNRSASDANAKWFLANFLASTQGKKIAGPEHHPVQPVGPNDRVLGQTLGSEVARNLFSLHRKLRAVAETLNPDGNPNHDRTLEELREYGAVTFRFFRALLESELPSGTLHPGEHVEVRRRWALVAVKRDDTPCHTPPGGGLPGNKQGDSEEGNPLTSIMTIVQHIKILQKLLGPGLQSVISIIRGMQ